MVRHIDNLFWIPAQKKKRKKKIKLAQGVAIIPHLLYDTLFFTSAWWLLSQRCLLQELSIRNHQNVWPFLWTSWQEHLLFFGFPSPFLQSVYRYWSSQLQDITWCESMCYRRSNFMMCSESGISFGADSTTCVHALTYNSSNLISYFR